MRTAKILVGLVLVFFGAVWTLQGLGSTFVPVSFMTNARIWVAIGLITALGGAALVARSYRRS
ncbi:MAG: hypothetical protein GWP18_04415 [Proteobacteria bacterium]|nr:hypothetical protein [Pseudomonadota bacterium]